MQNQLLTSFPTLTVAAGFELNLELSRVVFYPLYMDRFVGLCLKENRKGKGRIRNQMGRKTFLDLDYADDLSILDESVSKMKEIIEVFASSGC